MDDLTTATSIGKHMKVSNEYLIIFLVLIIEQLGHDVAIHFNCFLKYTYL